MTPDGEGHILTATDTTQGIQLTEGTAAAMIGGEPREAARRSIEAIFRFATLEWLPNSDAEAQLLEQRILAGSVE
ncbi:MAG: hypothetical protein ACSLFQ_08170 [Thermoanaerobaculia bacterium]